MGYKIIDAISKNKVPQWGNQKKYIAVHYLGVVGQNHDLASDGCGAHFYIYWDGTIYQRCSLDAVVWAVGTGKVYQQKHPVARNANTISIEMCCKCDGNSSSAEDKKWYFTKETQEACVWLVKKLMKELSIPAENVLRHYDIVNKTCPAPYVHNNKYRTSWTWDEFRAKVAGVEIKSDPLYKVRKTWKDEKTQIFAGTLEGAKNACAIGYSVFDENGNVVYTNKNTTTDDNIDKIWMGWVKRETGSAGLRCIHGDAGKAYGMQFDYRYGLIDFLKYCVEYNPTRYAPFNKFISLGKGSSKLVYNQELGNLWQQFYDKYTAEFEALQYTCAYKNYYLPVKQYLKKLYGINLDNHSPAVKGTAWSMSFRSGQETGAKKFAGCNDSTADSEMLRIAYSKYGSSDANRWTKNGQWGDAIEALNNNTYTEVCKELTNNNDPTNEAVPPKTPSEEELLYRVGTDWKDGKCQNQTNAYTILSNAKKEADVQSKANKSAYYVFDSNGAKIYTSTYKESKFEPYNVRVKIPDLRIRDAANGNVIYNENGSEKVTGIGVFGIIEEKKAGKYTWGRLLSKAGWIALSSDYVQKL